MKNDNHAMDLSTQGLELQKGSRWWRSSVELLSSMRFSISLLTLICIASIIGTIIKQQEPLNNYVNQFGPFWAQVFDAASLYTVYSAWWFLLIMAFLVLSTSLCIARNAPKILLDVRQFKAQMREQSLRAFSHRGEAVRSQEPSILQASIQQDLQAHGWQVKTDVRPQGVMLAAKKGAANKLGYIAAHAAIVMICIGGLLDGDLFIRAQTWWGGKSTYLGGGLISDVPVQHRLSPQNPSFRGNMLVSEGGRNDTVILAQPAGVMIQDLDFGIELKKFEVAFYPTGMPKLFASDIVLIDKQTGAETPARVEVNKPVAYHGVHIYQSSFDDGGSALTFKAWPFKNQGPTFEVKGVVGSSNTLQQGQTKSATGVQQQLTLELTGLRVFNVENMGAAAASGADVRAVDLREKLVAHLGSGNMGAQAKVLRNVGPSVSYKLRDEAGQAREYQNYMSPIDMGGAKVFVAGVRETQAENFRYLRMPADEQDSLEGWMRLHWALHDQQLREKAIARYVQKAIPSGRNDLVQPLQLSAQRALDLFVGGDSAATEGGLKALSDFIDNKVAAAEREKTGEVLVRILNGVVFELYQISRERAGLPPATPNAQLQAFMTQAVLALSDAFYYPAPLYLQLSDFKQVQASVFQLTRSPGKWLVYTGCLFLVIGVFAMLYVRERRLWVWLQSLPEGKTAVQWAFSSQRKTLDFEQEFQQLQSYFQTESKGKA